MFVFLVTVSFFFSDFPYVFLGEDRKSLNMEIRLKEMQLKIDRSDEQLKQLNEKYNKGNSKSFS